MFFKKICDFRAWWLIAVIPATREAEIRKFEVPD
jgi:hypothetical protein